MLISHEIPINLLGKYCCYSSPKGDKLCSMLEENNIDLSVKYHIKLINFNPNGKYALIREYHNINKDILNNLEQQMNTLVNHQ